jgi:hypothetical protein
MAIENLDERIGYFNKDGKRVMPRVNVSGLPYSYPGSWWHLDSNRFVVIPPNFRDEAMIADIKAQLGIGVKPSPKAAKADAKEDSDGE